MFLFLCLIVKDRLNVISIFVDGRKLERNRRKPDQKCKGETPQSRT